MKKHRRIEVNAFRRRVTIVSGVSGECSDLIDATTPVTDDEVSLNDIDSCEPVEPDSPEGQLLLVEAVRTLERRLSPETRATISADQNTLVPTCSRRNGFCLKLQSLYQLIRPRALRFARKEK